MFTTFTTFTIFTTFALISTVFGSDVSHTGRR